MLDPKAQKRKLWITLGCAFGLFLVFLFFLVMWADNIFISLEDKQPKEEFIIAFPKGVKMNIYEEMKSEHRRAERGISLKVMFDRASEEKKELDLVVLKRQNTGGEVYLEAIFILRDENNIPEYRRMVNCDTYTFATAPGHVVSGLEIQEGGIWRRTVFNPNIHRNDIIFISVFLSLLLGGVVAFLVRAFFLYRPIHLENLRREVYSLGGEP